MKRILISGAGITGLTLAYWLEKFGFKPTVIDRAPSPRTAADIVHAMGHGYSVLEKMDLAGRIRGLSLDLREIEFVDAANRILGRAPLQAPGNHADNRICHIPRSDLEAALRETLDGKIRLRQGTSIRRLDQQPDGVSVLFEDHDWERYDMVIGADGLHSNVRRKAFGMDERYEYFCGYHMAVFTIDSYRMNGTVVCHISPERSAGVFGRGKHATAFFLFRGLPRLGIPEGDTKGQKRHVRQVFDGAGWNCPKLLDYMENAPDFHFIPVSQIRMDAWSRGSIVLAGDAAYCPSSLSGQGASLALSGAYILAGELNASEGDSQRAFTAYENRLRPSIMRNQDRGGELPLLPVGKMGSWLNLNLSGWLGNPLVAEAVVAKRLANGPELIEY